MNLIKKKQIYYLFIILGDISMGNSLRNTLYLYIIFINSLEQGVFRGLFQSSCY